MLKQFNKICCICFKRPCNKLKMAKRVSSDKTDLLPLKRVYYGQHKNNPKTKDEHKLQTAPETADYSISKYPVPVIENMSSKSQELMQPTENKTLLPLKLVLPCTDKDTVKLPPLKQTEFVKNIYKILSDGDQRLQNTSNNSVFESESLSETLCDVTKSSNPVVTELMPTILCDANKSNNSAIVTESLSATLYDVTKSDSSIFGRESLSAASCDITKISNTVSGIESLSTTSCIVTSKEQPKVPGFVLVQLGRTPKPIFGSQLVKGTSESSLQSEQKTDRMKNANYTVKICETSLQMSHVKANLLESETFTNTSESAKDTLLEGNHTSEFVVKTTDTNIKGLETIKETTRNQLCMGVPTIINEENKVKHETIEAVTERIDSPSEGVELNILGTSQADTGSTNEKCILTSLAIQMATPDKTKQVVKMPSASIKIRTHTSDAEEIIAISLPVAEMMTSLNDEKTVTANKTALATVVKDAIRGLSVLNEAFEKDKEAVLNATEMVTESSDFIIEMMSSVNAYIHENILADSSCDTLAVCPVSCSFNGKENRCETDPDRGLKTVNDKENKGNNVDPQSQVNINGKDVRCENEQELITVDDQKNGHEYDTANSQRQVNNNINHKVDICETVMMQGQTEPGLINLVLSTSEEISSDTRITKSSQNAAELASSQQDIFHPAVLEEQHVDAVKTFVHISDELMAPSEICSKNDDQGLIDFCQGNIETCKKEVPVENNSLALIIKDEFLDTKLPNENDIDSPQNVCMKDMNFSDKRSIRKDENFELGFVEGPEESSIMASCKLLPPKRKLGVLPPVMLTKVVSLVKDNVRTFASEIMSSKNAPASQVKKESAIIDKKAVKSNDGTTSVDTSPVSIQKSDCTSIKNSKKSGKNKKKTEKMKILDDSETEKKKLLQEVLPQYIPESDSRKRKKNKRDRVYNISHIFSENFGQESKKSNRPNFFVAVQITSQKIKDGLSEVQATIEKINKEMKTAFIALDTLHITLMVMHLSDDEAVTRARTALDNSHTQRADSAQEELNFCVKGLGHFRNQVIYAEVEKGPALDRLSAIAETVKTCMNEQNICPFDKSTFTPHITIMKMSKNPKKLKAAGIKKIPEELYNTFKFREFGCQTLCTIQLCSMMKPKRNKYYHIEYEIPF